MASLLGQLILNGISMGLVYVILATGIVLILSASRILYLAYGSLYMIGAFAVWGAIALLKLPYFISLCIGVLLTTLLGLASYQLILRHLQHREKPFLLLIVAAIGLMMILDQAGLLVFGTIPRGLPAVFPGVVDIAGVSITVEKLVVVVLALAMALVLFFIYEKTGIGRAIRAVSFSPKTALLQGVNINKIYFVTIGIGCALAGFAGGIMAPVYGVFPGMGSNVILYLLLIIMLGGMDSMVGAVISGLIFGMTLSFGEYFIGGLVQILLFAVIGIIIFFRPGGLFGSGAELEV